MYDGAGERIARIGALESGSDLFTLSLPCRAVDTRGPTGPYGGPIFTGGEERTYTLAGYCGLSSNVSGIVGNLLAAEPSSAGFLRLVPGGSGAEVSTVNFNAGRTIANNFRLGLSAACQATLTAGVANTHAVLDLTGYYQRPPATWTLTLRDEGNRLATEYSVTSGGASRTKNYLHFGNLLVGLRHPWGEHWSFVSDHLGTPRAGRSRAATVLRAATRRRRFVATPSAGSPR